MNFVILAGGSGTRLFPLSRKNYPKQFMKIGNSNQKHCTCYSTRRKGSIFCMSF